MLQIKGHKIPSSSPHDPLKSLLKIPPKDIEKEKPLSKEEILKAFSLSPRSQSPIKRHENLSEINNLEKEILPSDELLNQIEQEASKIHESLQLLKKSREFFKEESPTNLRFSKNLPENEKSNEKDKSLDNSQIKGYDSDPEYYHFQEKSASENKNRSFSLERTQKNRIDYKDYAKRDLEKKSLGFTVPKPFNFEVRESQKNMSISKRRFLEDLEKRQNSEKENLRQRFRANPVPEHIKDRHLYEKLKKQEEQRRRQVKENSKTLTMQREKPFSFYLRDQNKQPKKTTEQRKQWKLQAKPIPWYCTIPLLQRIQEEEEAKRRERVAKEAQKLIDMSHLPSRMEKHEQEKKAKALKQSNSKENLEVDEAFVNKNLTFRPAPRKKVPDFKRLQDTFQELLDRTRSNKRPVVPKPFNFEASRKPADRDYLNEENVLKKKEIELIREDPMEKWHKNAAKKPKIQPPSTKKWEEAYEKRKKEKEYKEACEQEIISQQKEKELKRKEFEARVRGSPAIGDNTKLLQEKKQKILKEKRQEIKRTEENYKEILEKINDKVRKRLLLVENYEEGSRKAKLRDQKKNKVM